MDHAKDSVATGRAHPRTSQKPTWVVAPPSSMVSETVVAAEMASPLRQEVLGRGKENSHATEKDH